jgi:hypothetical protein
VLLLDELLGVLGVGGRGEREQARGRAEGE